MALHAVWRASGAPLYLSSEAGALALSLAGRENLSFDGEGRLVGAWIEQITYRRALDNRVLAKWIDPARPGRRLRRFLDEVEVVALLGHAVESVARVRDGLASDALAVAPYLEWLERAANWTPARYAAEAGRFAAVYKPIPILPPDQYMALVVQATEGCSYNDCSFCTFYRDRPFRIKRVDELRAHVAGVLGLLGRGITLRRKLFLADANAVVVAQKTLLPVLDALNAALPILPAGLEGAERAAWDAAHPWRLDGIYAFVSAPDALRKSADDFAALRARNLRRVYVGLETGCDPLRRFLRKQGSAGDVRAAVETMKAGGLRLGAIFMAGIGGAAYREAHFADTVALLKSLPLGPGDLVYVSPFVAEAGSPYTADAQAAGLRPLDEMEIEEEEARFRAALLPWAQARGVKVSRYDVREFVY
jgi:hypothetical protein